MTEPLLQVSDLALHFYPARRLFHRGPALRAVDGVSFELAAGETLGLVGESGCGKSSLGKALLNLYRPTRGEVRMQGQLISALSERDMRPLRRDMQMIFQDPFESLNARHTVSAILEEPLIIHRVGDRASRQKRVAALLDQVGLPQSALDRYPHEFSGGQRQRIGIARAIALQPKLLICDEAVSALDVSVQAQILNLLMEIQRELGLSMLFISHDISVVQHVSDRIAVMYLGEIVEIGKAQTVRNQPAHPYTQALLAAVPQLGAEQLPLVALEGDMPSPMDMPKGCRFAGRCPHSRPLCRETAPLMAQEGPHAPAVACHFWREISPQLP